MLAYQCARCRERIAVAYQLHGTGIILRSYKRNISRHIYMSGTHSDARYCLSSLTDTAMPCDMTFIFIGKLIKAVKDKVCRRDTHSAVRRLGDHTAHIPDPIRSAGCRSTFENAVQHSFYLNKSVSAGYAFPAGLVHRYLQQRAIKREGAHPRRI